jgi:hypothetical protein
LKEFLAVADVIRQYVRIVTEPGMTIELARLLAQKGLMLAPVAGAYEFEGSEYVLQTDRHGDPRQLGIVRHNVLYVELFKHLLKHEDLLNLSDAVMNAWRQQLGHDAEDDEAGFP